MRNFGQIRGIGLGGYGRTAEEMAAARRAAYQEYQSRRGEDIMNKDFTYKTKTTMSGKETEVTLIDADLLPDYDWSQNDIFNCDKVVVDLAKRVAAKGRGGAHQNWKLAAMDVVPKISSGKYSMTDFIKKMRS